MFNTILKLQLASLKRNLTVAICLAIIALVVVGGGAIHHKIVQAIGYLFVMWLGSFITDIYVFLKPVTKQIPVRSPKKEAAYVIICTLLGFLFLILRFDGFWEHMNGIARLSTVVLIPFAFPIALAVIMLLLKYKLSDLGIALNGLVIAIPIIILISGTAFCVSPGGFTLEAVLKEAGGVEGLLFEGFISAALAEEFWRYIAQSRFGALFNNNGMGWLVAAIIWSLMHVPKWLADGDIAEAFYGAIRIVPIGLMWSYMSYRTRNILPSVIVHGLNMWGLQNF
jgi:membrane protease YdiL (CAAX protease family)